MGPDLEIQSLYGGMEMEECIVHIRVVPDSNMAASWRGGRVFEPMGEEHCQVRMEAEAGEDAGTQLQARGIWIAGSHLGSEGVGTNSALELQKICPTSSFQTLASRTEKKTFPV